MNSWNKIAFSFFDIIHFKNFYLVSIVCQIFNISEVRSLKVLEAKQRKTKLCNLYIKHLERKDQLLSTISAFCSKSARIY